MVAARTRFAIALIGTILLDQATKYLLRHRVAGYTTDLIPGLIRITPTTNTGAAFGILQNSSLLLSIASIIIIGILLYVFRDLAAHPWASIFTGAVIGGAIGNLVDRLLYGAVTDFIDLRFWPATFNLADLAITIGAIGIVSLQIWSKRPVIK